MCNRFSLVVMLALGLSGCFLAHGEEDEDVSIAEEGEVLVCEAPGGCSLYVTRIPAPDGCLVVGLHTCDWMPWEGRIEPYDLRVESDTRRGTFVRFSEHSCEASLDVPRDWSNAPAVEAASGRLRVFERDEGLRIEGDVSFTARDGLERRVIIREQDAPAIYSCL